MIIGVVTSGIFAFEFVPHLFPQGTASSFMLNSKTVKPETLESVQTICRKLDIDESHKIKVTVGEGIYLHSAARNEFRCVAILLDFCKLSSSLRSYII